MISNATNTTTSTRDQTAVPTILNAYAIRHPLTWQVNVYRVERLIQEPAATPQDMRGLLHEYARRVARQKFSGPFWTLDTQHVAAPVSCQLPTGDYQGYRITSLPVRTIDAQDPEQSDLVRDILKSATRDALKSDSELGDLIQDGLRFVEQPSARNLNGELHYCRRYEVRPMTVRVQGGEVRWVLQMVVDTVSIDAHPISRYYREGQVEQLADFILAKRKNRRTRAGGPTAIRALYLPDGGGYGQFGRLSDPERILTHANLDPSDQQHLVEEPHPCTLYRQGKQEEMPLPGESIHLVLDTQITGENHDDTILDVPVRNRVYRQLHAAIDGTAVYGVTLNLERDLVRIESAVVRPPALKLRGRELAAPRAVTFKSLQERNRTRANHVRRHGYLYSFADINPLLAVPRQYGRARGEQLAQQLQDILTEQNHNVRVAGPVPYESVDDIAAKLGEHDALIAVLPEGSRQAQHANDTHEQIKRKLSVTSQCIQKDRTRRVQGDTERQARNAGFNAQAVVSNLLVKHGWIPFLPAEPGHYNVRFGIDVGGVQNNKVMVCVGYGFAEALPAFRAEEIKVGREQAEPILDGPLYLGMVELLARMREWVAARGVVPNFNRLLIFRDGDSNGEAGVWQERDAFSRLHAEFLKQEWIDDQASWVLVEISKRAAGWRQLQLEDGRPVNPLVGTYSFPFEDPSHALVSTTGSPTLAQGTAQPLLVKMSAVAGAFDPREVVHDLIWEADLCFTKLDHGYALPYTLHVADAGALQLARTYSVSGFTL
ncbi:hypothetical protein [Deinococcus soli (ex Cha et al. 2016)]|uniref:hypothetical protein n=1 Tax=Deinococcus soli (ex Cha et al. 2016) TaxID=1309411 RepID=UPI0016637418|nr:hypothetical protein [Deinococcus soli (ex Cha et al. 2016)]GGB76486.1 hypothetical protein GCM10008019_35870 [Deinococcus soli (ex Cha et al. 2016)]